MVVPIYIFVVPIISLCLLFKFVHDAKIFLLREVTCQVSVIVIESFFVFGA